MTKLWTAAPCGCINMIYINDKEYIQCIEQGYRTRQLFHQSLNLYNMKLPDSRWHGIEVAATMVTGQATPECPNLSFSVSAFHLEDSRERQKQNCTM